MSSVVSSTQFGKSKWALIEKPLDKGERERTQILCDLGENMVLNNSYLKNNLVTIGDYYYLSIRDKLLKHIKLSALKVKLEKEFKINKKTQMILNNNTNIVEQKINSILRMFGNDIEDINYEEMIYSNEYIEMRIIILMKFIDYYLKTNNVREIEEITLACNKIYNLIEKSQSMFDKICNIEGFDIGLSGYLMTDFKTKMNELSERHNIRLYEIANRRPKLIFETKYDSTISIMKMRPYASQTELINIVKDNLDNGFLIYLKTLTGLGKTTSVLSISKYVSLLNQGYKVLFCCSNLLDSVRIQVAKLMFNFGMKFGIGNAIGNDKYQIKISWNYATDKSKLEQIRRLENKDNMIDYHKIHICDTIICDYITTYLILKKNKEFKFILFFDEPTLMTDNLEHGEILEYLNKIMYYAPKNTILSSATLPRRLEIMHLETHFNNKYPDAFVGSISSNKTLVGCIIKDFDNNVITPHIHCKNHLELQEFIKKILQNPLLGKFYTLPYLMNLNKFMENYGLNIQLENITTFEQENILENILYLLNKIDENIDFNEFLKIKCSLMDENEFDVTKLDNDFNKIDYSKLLTFHAFKYMGTCLIADGNPLEFVRTHFYPKVELIKEQLKIKNIGDEIVRYQKQMKDIESKIENIYNTVPDDENGVRDEMITNVRKSKKPLKYKSFFQVNTLDHFNKFSTYVKKYDASLFCSKIDYEELDVNAFSIDDNLKFLLFMGVGVYSLSLDENYTNTVLELLNERKLAYVVSGEEFSYGSNYPISKIIINDSIGDNHSINTILQIIGRTGRVGKSYFGEVFIDKNTVEKLVNFFNDSNYVSNEGSNINLSFIKVTEDIAKEHEKKRLELIKREEQLKKIEEERIRAQHREEERLKKLEEERLRKQEEEKLFRKDTIPVEEDSWRRRVSPPKREPAKEEEHWKKPISDKIFTKTTLNENKIKEQSSKEDKLFQNLFKKK